jgi:ubiquinone/menaquinone biosynthesis C-methylase UbiE
MTRRWKRWLVALLVVVLIGGAFAAGELPYLPVVHGSTADEIDRMAAWLEVKPGMHLADVGAGDGTHAVALAQRVGPSGRVYANEISAAQLEVLRQKAAAVPNLSVVAGAVAQTNLPDACCDVIMSRFVYHHLADAPAINADLARKLRPGGRLLIIDFEPGGLRAWLGMPPETGHGTRKERLMKEVSAAGFQAVRGPERWRGRVYAVLLERG